MAMHKIKSISLVSTIGIAVFGYFFVSAATALPIYTLTNLGVFDGGSTSEAIALNDSRRVVGISSGTGGSRAFFIDSDAPGAALQQLGTAGALSIRNSLANDVNNSGLVVGSATRLAGGGSRAFVFDSTDTNAVMLSLGTLENSNTTAASGNSSASAVNNSGLVVGGSSIAALSSIAGGGGQSRAFVFDTADQSASMRSLGVLGTGERSNANDVNDNGLVVGGSRTVPGSGPQEAFIIDGTDAGASMRGLGTLPGGTTSNAQAINNAGLVVGESNLGGVQSSRAFAIDGTDVNAAMRDLGVVTDGLGNQALGSQAFDVNDSGLVVGLSFFGFSINEFRAFIFDSADSSAEMQDLNSLIDPNDPLSGDVNITIAFGINSAGDIAAQGLINGQVRAFLLTANNSDPSATVPEPGSLALFGIGLVGLGVLRRRRRAA